MRFAILKKYPLWWWIFLVVWLAAGVLRAPNASASEVFVKNKALEGSVVGVTAQGVEFQTIYGKGTILIQQFSIHIAKSVVFFGD
jgi:hypothetical protein